MKKARLAWLLAVAAFAALVQAEPTSSDAIIQLLNSRAAGSPRGYAEAAGVVARDAAEGKLLQRFVVGVVSRDFDAPDELKVSPEVRNRYLDETRERIMTLAEQKNNPLAWYLLSLEKNDVKFLQRAADGGNPQALNAWGTRLLTKAVYARGVATNDVDKLMARSYKCFETAAGQDDANGLYNLGMCKLKGYGCEIDKDEAYECFMAAAKKGHPEAINNIGGFYRDGIVVAENPGAATIWFKKSADLGNAYGQLNYALALQRGEGVAQDEALAARLLEKSARQKCVEAIDAYGMCLYHGRGVEKDTRKACVWYLSAAKLGFAPAMENLAHCYDVGEGVPKNSEEALVWKIRARAAQGDRNAASWLAQNHKQLEIER